ncbi:MAG: pimeloyl-ACP methyl ester esterase BioH [Gammaproteobacteria bacterium]
MRLHVETAGQGPSLVLLHGWGMHSGIWSTLLPELVRQFRVSCVDLPGHGRSPPPAGPLGLEESADAVAAIAPRGAAWLGWSLGGQVALAAALAGADIRRLVLVATTPRFVAAPDWPCGMAAATLAGFAASLANDHRKTVRDFLVLQLRGDRHAAVRLAELRRVLDERAEPAPKALRAGLDILATTDLRTRLAAVRQPTLVIAGERDRLTPGEAGQRLAAGLPDGRLLTLPGAAHVPFLSHPGAFAEAVAGFLLDDEAAA